MATSSKVTTDHNEIRRWVEKRGGHPARVRATGGKRDLGVLRIDYPGFSGGDRLEEISWDDFFEDFDRNNLAFLYQDRLKSGKESRFSKLVDRSTASTSRKASSSKRASSGSSSRRTGSGRSSATGSSKSASKGSTKKSATKKSAAKKASAKSTTSRTKSSAGKSAGAKSSASKKRAASSKRTTTSKSAAKSRGGASGKKSSAARTTSSTGSAKRISARSSSTSASKKASSKSSAKGSAKSSKGRGRASSKGAGGDVTTDHDTIRRWVEERGGHPASVVGTGKRNDAGLLRIDFPGYSGEGSLEEISWEDFFRKFDREKLAFLFQNRLKNGRISRFFKLIAR